MNDQVEKLNKDLFRRDEYEIISPYASNSEIWNKEMFDIEIIKQSGKKLVILTYKDKLAFKGLE